MASSSSATTDATNDVSTGSTVAPEAAASSSQGGSPSSSTTGTGAAGGGGGGGDGSGGGGNGKLFWTWDVEDVGRWVRSIHALHPPKPPAPTATEEAKTADNDDAANDGKAAGNKTPAEIAALARRKAEIAAQRQRELAEKRRLDAEARENWKEQRETAERLTANLLRALASATLVVDGDDDAAAPAEAAPATGAATGGEGELTAAQRYEQVRAEALVAAGVMPKGAKGAAVGGNTSEAVTGEEGAAKDGGRSGGNGRADLYNVLDPSFARGKDVVHLPGAILSRLGMGGLTNALSGVEGGVVDPATNVPLPGAAATRAANSSSPTNGGGKGAKSSPPPAASAAAAVPPEVKKFARVLRRAVSAKVEMDMLESTPRRIVEMLCPEVSMPEIARIRRRVYATVVLGQGTNASAAAAALENPEDLPVAARTAVHDVDKWKKCKVCGNNDQSDFVLDKRNGDLICTHCGTVAAESLMHEGSQYRKFEGEADRNHHGDAANPLFSNAHNMSTTLGGVGFQSGAGGGGWGAMGSRRGMENVLRNAHAYTEMNISQFGKEEKKTRIGYKDRQKKDAFMKMTHVGDALTLHDAVVQRGKELFAEFRDDRELVQDFKGVVAACLCEAFDQLSKDGRRLLKVRAGELDDDEENLTGRASWRNNMHKATAASTNILSDMPAHLKEVLANGTTEGGDASGATSSACELKPAASWDIDDCRSWLLEASRAIARQWTEAKEADAELASALPKGTLDELEGKLVEHTFALCDALEQELATKDKRKMVAGRQRVTTPRVNDMAHLSIKWQGSHERGSGGKGGVGNSGRTLMGTKPGERSDRSAGQILILKSAKKLTAIIKDPIAGEAFHKELRALLGRQESRKRKERSNEVAQQRFKQMKRKPWLQARAKV